MEPIGIATGIGELAKTSFEVAKYIYRRKGFSIKLLFKGAELEEILSKLAHADKEILLHMADIQKPLDTEFDESARKIICHVYDDQGALIKIVNSRWFNRYFKRIKTSSYLDIAVDDDLSEIKFYLNGCFLTENCTRLLWPCNCKVPDKYKNSSIPCPIHSREEGKRIQYAFEHGLIRIQFKNNQLFYKNVDSLWPPSIDSLFFALLLEKHFGNSKNLKSIADVGSGTGFLGIYLSNINEGIKEVNFIDMFASPVFLSQFNFFINSKARKIKSTSVASDCFHEIAKKRFDLVICNPPYLPLLGISDFAKLNAVTGTYLLKEVLLESGKFSDQLVFGCSDIAKPDLNDYLKQLEILYTKMHIEEIGSIDAPFRVNHAFETGGYMSKLLKSRKAYFAVKDDSPFKLWHKIRYYHVTYR